MSRSASRSATPWTRSSSTRPRRAERTASLVELNLPQIHEAIAAAIPDRDCIVHRGEHLSWARVTDDTRRLAAFLAAQGIGRRGSLADCEQWESPHDHVALYLHNGPEYLEAMLGTMKAGAAAVNVNYRYVAEELTYLLTDSA